MCPDEKGTEIGLLLLELARLLRETLCAPMRRGLKSVIGLPVVTALCETLCAPMRRGLKCDLVPMIHGPAQRNIVCPDEKGTEIT